MSNVVNWIGGRPVRTDATLANIDPATGAVIGTIPRSDADMVDSAVSAANAAFPRWAATPAPARADVLDALADALHAQREAFAGLESRDNGKPITLARSVDIPRAVANLRFFAGAARQMSTGCHPMADAINYTLRQPVGVFGLITPWNLPLYLLTWKLAPALAMGNTVVCKPSEMTPSSASALATLASEVGLPDGVFNVVHGLGGECGQALVEHPRVPGISFTGGTATGKRVAATAAPMFKKLSLELGGKNPTLIFDDADLSTAIRGAVRSAYLNQGQICLCGSRILVQRGVYDQVVAGMVERMGTLVTGDPSNADSDLGSLISHDHLEKVASYVALSQREGGTIVAGGTVPDLPAPFDKGAFFLPTLITGLAPTCRTSTEEIFGPVATIHPFDTEEEAIAIANEVRYGLASSVWTENLGRAHRVSANLKTGMVWVNTWLKRDLRVPFGGVKDSGVGREGGWYSLKFYSEDKNICVQL